MHLAPKDFQNLLKVSTGETNDVLSHFRKIDVIKDDRNNGVKLLFRLQKRQAQSRQDEYSHP